MAGYAVRSASPDPGSSAGGRRREESAAAHQPALGSRLSGRLRQRARHPFAVWVAVAALLIAVGTISAVLGARAVSSNNAERERVAFASSSATIASAIKLGLANEQDLELAAGAFVPYGLLKFKRARLLKAFNIALPDAIDLMARALRAGHSMSSSIELIAEQSPQPLSGEFVQVYQQQKFGLRFRDALLQMADRIPSRDLQFLVTAILVQKETGGDLTEILDRTSHVIRERVRIEGEVRTHTAQGRLTGWILGLLPVIMLGLINIVSPGYSTVLFHDPVGQKLLYAGATLIVIGGLVIRKIVDVEV